MKKILKVIYFIAGFGLGLRLGEFLAQGTLLSRFLGLDFTQKAPHISLLIISGIIIGIIFLIIIPFIVRGIVALSKLTVNHIKNTSFTRIIYSVGGLIVSLILAALVSMPIYKINLPSVIISILVILVYVVFACLGLVITSSKIAEIDALFKAGDKRMKDDKTKVKKYSGVPKILDTSVIIDGRIFDILKTGFMDGPVIIPEFVLDELRYIADSEDNIKRGRGRRGIDILNRIQKEIPIEVVITNKDYPQVNEVDNKLLTLAQEMKGKVVTNDYNLNKIAEFRGVEVLNTNDLSNAVKAIVLPGEELAVQVIKEGKEMNQGVAYTDDGTMVVIENGKSYIGKNINTVVTSVLQTSAGRLIFVKPHRT